MKPGVFLLGQMKEFDRQKKILRILQTDEKFRQKNIAKKEMKKQVAIRVIFCYYQL